MLLKYLLFCVCHLVNLRKNDIQTNIIDWVYQLLSTANIEINYNNDEYFKETHVLNLTVHKFQWMKKIVLVPCHTIISLRISKSSDCINHLKIILLSFTSLTDRKPYGDFFHKMW